MMMWRSLDQRVLGDVLAAAFRRWVERPTAKRAPAETEAAADAPGTDKVDEGRSDV